MITTFFFDLGGVLFTNSTKRFIKRISVKYGIPESAIKKAIDNNPGSKYYEAKINRNEFWREFIQTFHLKETADVLEKQWLDGYKIINGTKSIIEKIAEKYRVFYLSDNIKERVDFLNKKYAFEKMFEGGIYSHLAGIRKPKPGIYKLALKKSESKPKETVYIDDRQVMLDPAKKIGFKTILFTSPEELRKALIKEKYL